MAYISQLAVSLDNDQEQQLTAQGFIKLPQDLNKGLGRNQIYLWFKKGPTAITSIQVSFKRNMEAGLASAGYTKIDKNLNALLGGDSIYLWYFQGSGEYHTPIVDITVTTDGNNEAAKFKYDWERLACDLNRGVGVAWIHLWVKREKITYICDITATDSYGSDTDLLGSGYMRVDENTNRGAGGSEVFIWYRQTTDTKGAVTDLKISISDKEYYAFQQQGYTIVNVNLNDKAGGNPVYLWYKKGGPKNPIQDIPLLVNIALVDDYIKAGLTVIEKDLNAGNPGYVVYLCVYQ